MVSLQNISTTLQEDFALCKNAIQGNPTARTTLQQQVSFVAFHALGALVMAYGAYKLTSQVFSILSSIISCVIAGVLVSVGHDLFVISHNMQQQSNKTQGIWDRLKDPHVTDNTLIPNFWNLVLFPLRTQGTSNFRQTVQGNTASSSMQDVRENLHESMQHARGGLRETTEQLQHASAQFSKKTQELRERLTTR